MSYRDPYADPHYGGGNPYLSHDATNYGQNQYSDPPLAYNPYTGPSHPTYDQSGYGPGAHEEQDYDDEPTYPPQRKPTQRTTNYADESTYPPQRTPTQRTMNYADESDYPSPPQRRPTQQRTLNYADEPDYPPQRRPTQRSLNYADGPDYTPQRRGTHQTQYSGSGGLHHRKDSYQPNTEFSSLPRPEKTPSNMRQYRYDHQGALWTKGGRGRCFGRFCCCTLMTALVLIISIGLALALWVRPPGVIIGNIAPVSKAGSTIEIKPDGDNVSFTIHLALNITVDNPNYFSVDFKKIKADLTYPINNTPIGGGEANNIVFKTQTQTDWTFFIEVQYSTSADPNGLVLSDLLSKCGANKKNIDVNYKISLELQVLFLPISPTVSNSMSFLCPLDENMIKQITGGTGIPGIAGL